MEKIGIIGAMDEEIENYLGGMENIAEIVEANIHFYQGKMNNKSVVVSKSGVGKVNSAVCTQILIDKFKIDQVIFTGVAGAIHPELEIGDVVISTTAMQHDMDASALGFAKGTIPFSEKSVFNADKHLVDMAYEASNEVSRGNTYKGMILSGDQFIAGGEQAKSLYEQFEGFCTEMEGAAVAQVCDMNEIPFVIVRSLSDKADGSAHVNFAEFSINAAENSYRIVHKMLGKINV